MPVDEQQSTRSRFRSRAGAVGSGATAAGRDAFDALVGAVGALVDAAVDRVLLRDARVASAAEARRLLAGEAETEELADKIQRVIVLAVPVVRMAVRGARYTRIPWVMLASSVASIGIAVRTGVRELQLLGSLVAYRLEQGGAVADPALVKKVAVDLYLHPRREPALADDKLRLVRLTRKWVLGGAFGRTTKKRALRAFATADTLDGADLSMRWRRLHAADEDQNDQQHG